MKPSKLDEKMMGKKMAKRMAAIAGDPPKKNYYAFISGSECRIVPLGPCENFDEADEKTCRHTKGFGYAPFIFDEESLRQFVNSARKALK